MSPSQKEMLDLLIAAVTSFGAARRHDRKCFNDSIETVRTFAVLHGRVKLKQLSTIGSAMSDQFNWKKAEEVAVELVFEYLLIQAELNTFN